MYLIFIISFDIFWDKLKKYKGINQKNVNFQFQLSI